MTEKHQNENDYRLHRIFLEDDSSGWLSADDLIRRALGVAEGDDPVECRSCFDFLAGLLGMLLVDRDFDVRQGAGGGAVILPRAKGDKALFSRSEKRPTDLNWNGLWQAVTASHSRIGLNSSGTSGDQKRIVHSIGSLTRSVRIADQRKNDVWGLAFHPASFAGLQVLFQALGNRNPIVRLFGHPVDRIHTMIEANGVNHLSATPTFLRMLQSEKKIHAGVRRLNISGEQTDSGLIERLKRVFPNAQIRNLYASTEAGSLLSSDCDVFRIPEHLGDKVRIENGELVVHRSLLADADCQSDANAPFDENEFFRTGDRVEIVQQEPFVFRFLARDALVINVGGRKVIPERVEAAMNEIDGVVDCVAWGQPNAVSGSLVCCDVVLDDNAPTEEAELKRLLRQRLEPHEVPRVIRFVSELELTETGKKRRGAGSGERRA